MSCGDEIRVGGPLDEKRLRAIMSRGFLLRNLCVSEEEAFEYKARSSGWSSQRSELGPDQDTDGETPYISHDQGDGGETRHESYSLHVGCGDICGILAEIPWCGDMGCAPRSSAEAIAHAGRDMIDLVREVVALRSAVVLQTKQPNTVVLFQIPETMPPDDAQTVGRLLSSCIDTPVVGVAYPFRVAPEEPIDQAIARMGAEVDRINAAAALRTELEVVLGRLEGWVLSPQVREARDALRRLLSHSIPASSEPDGKGA